MKRNRGESVAENIGCVLLVVVIAIAVFSGYSYFDSYRHSLTFHGQIVAITPTTRGYVASIMCNRGHEGVIFTVAQANEYRVGDIIDYTAVYDGWGEFQGLSMLRKSQ